MSADTSFLADAALDDSALVARAQAGQMAAFDALVRRYQHRLIALMLRFVHERAEAEDLAQEAFLRAYRALPGFRGEAQFYTWLHRIAVNTAKSHLAARKCHPGSLLDVHDTALLQNEAALQELATPEDELLRHEVEAAMSQALAALSPELRPALLLREVDGLSYDAIAERLGCPPGTVRSRIYRAREALDAALRPVLMRSATARKRREK